LLSGLAEVDIKGERTRLTAHEATDVAAGKEHYFLNLGDEPMVILCIYGSDHVTRAFVGQISK
jgi:mannose-6-phosphate isomerase-like protein (cupin superfamily)